METDRPYYATEYIMKHRIDRRGAQWGHRGAYKFDYPTIRG